jgi:hypothetical protein
LDITVKGPVLGALLPASDGNENPGRLKNVPVRRRANGNEVKEALQFLLTGTPYITGGNIRGDGAGTSFGYFLILG